MEDFERFYNKALRFLSYRPRSEKEVRDRLKLKAQSSKVKITIQNSKLIDEVIQKLKDKRFINDEEFTKFWIESRLKFKPRSLRLMKLELKRKGIDKDLIDKMINDKGLMINELGNAQKLIEKRMPRYSGLDRQKIYEKLGRYLASKGFDWDTIKKSIDEVLRKRV